MTLSDYPPVMTLAQVAEFAGVSANTVYRRPKDFGGRKIRNKGNWRFPRETVGHILGIPQEGKA